MLSARFVLALFSLTLSAEAAAADRQPGESAPRRVASVNANRAVEVVVEVAPTVERSVPKTLVYRLIRLELADTRIPDPASAQTKDEHPTLFVRVLERQTNLLVQLWERGELRGERVVSLRGTSQLRARRISLATAELVRGLIERRGRQARLRKHRLRLLAQQRETRGIPLGRLVVGSGARGACIGCSEVWLFGPQVEVALRFSTGPQLALGLSMMVGPTPGVEGAGASEWFELSLSPSFRWRLSSRQRWQLGMTTAVGTMHFTNIGTADEMGAVRDSWSARAAVFSRYQLRLGSSWELTTGPEVGVMLRRVPVRSQSGELTRLGGLWLGLHLGVTLDPPGPRNVAPDARVASRPAISRALRK